MILESYVGKDHSEQVDWSPPKFTTTQVFGNVRILQRNHPGCREGLKSNDWVLQEEKGHTLPLKRPYEDGAEMCLQTKEPQELPATTRR